VVDHQDNLATTGILLVHNLCSRLQPMNVSGNFKLEISLKVESLNKGLMLHFSLSNLSLHSTKYC